jgi:cell division protein FtsB
MNIRDQRGKYIQAEKDRRDMISLLTAFFIALCIIGAGYLAYVYVGAQRELREERAHYEKLQREAEVLRATMHRILGPERGRFGLEGM